MIDIVGNKCCGCSACQNRCPRKSIVMTLNNEGFLYPEIKSDLCNHCNLCETVCPVLRKKHDVNLEIIPEKAWGAIVNNRKLHYESSSGGIFTLFAEIILKEKGIVYGAAFSDEFRIVKHIAIDNEKELYKLRGSKYIQSEVGICFSEIKSHLESGLKILFSGTPCQVAGLKTFLGKDYENLFCVDVICHGTPSASLWQKYLDHIEKQYNGMIISVNFRHKEKGWKEAF